jgi:hypothetical protein
MDGRVRYDGRDRSCANSTPCVEGHARRVFKWSLRLLGGLVRALLLVVRDGAEHAKVFVLKVVEVGLQLVMPGVQDEHLEAQRRTGDGEVGKGDESRDPHRG